MFGGYTKQALGPTRGGPAALGFEHQEEKCWQAGGRGGRRKGGGERGWDGDIIMIHLVERRKLFNCEGNVKTKKRENSDPDHRCSWV